MYDRVWPASFNPLALIFALISLIVQPERANTKISFRRAYFLGSGISGLHFLEVAERSFINPKGLFLGQYPCNITSRVPFRVFSTISSRSYSATLASIFANNL